ncbi:MAG: PAS domain S-box protein, partial [Luteolibacter sp.]
MNPKDTPPGAASTSADDENSQRLSAEAILSQRLGGEPDFIKGKSPFFLKRTMHDLQVHQIELEMQNEELRRAQADVEAARVRYFDLYDLAPVGYLTLTDQGVILESNYAASALLGKSRRGLAKQPLIWFIGEEDQDRYREQCRQVLETGLPQVTELRMKGRRGAGFWARLETTVARAANGTSEFRIVLTNITERKRAEEALKDSLEFSSSLIRYMQDGFSVLDLNGVAQDVNPALCEMTGFSQEELVGGKPPHPYWPPEEHERIAKALNETLTGTGPQEFELTFMRKNGVRFPVIVSPFAVKDRDGETVSYAAAVRNITAWKQAEQALKESEAFQKDILNSLSAHIAVLDKEGLIVAVNEPWLEFARTNGNPPGDQIGVGRSYLEVCKQALGQKDPYAEIAADGLNSVLSGKQNHFSMEYPCDSPECDRWFTMEVYVPASSGHGAIVAHTDISERKKAEEALRDANQKLRLHFEQTPMAVIEWDLDFRVTNWNPAAQTIFGYGREEAVGQHAAFIVPEAFRSQVDGVWQALILKNGGERSTNANVHKNGQPILCEWYNTPLIDERGIVAGVASVVMDVTERS